MKNQQNCGSTAMLFSNSSDRKLVLKQFAQRMNVAHKSPQTIKSYSRAIEFLMDFHSDLPENIEIDQVIDFLHYLKEEKELQWRTMKIYVAGLRFYYQEMLGEGQVAKQIPYPKEQKTLPVALSREELTKIFDNCLNDKHRVIFRLLYSSGLRRNELLNLKPEDIDTKDGKRRIRINLGKGSKDRFTILSEKVLPELRRYFISYKPKNYLFNGRHKGQQYSKEGMRHALKEAVKRAGIKKEVSLHTFRHCFATHCLEEGMDIKTLQYLMGHSSVQTTMVYLHISDIPLNGGFSPLDKWEK
jgi:site-specific recombinase XerD